MSDDLDPRPTTLSTSDGEQLECLVHAAGGAEVARGSAAIAHPHPQFGGDLHNNVVTALWRGFAAAHVATVRCNFRGVGASTGAHGDGSGERLDHLAALDVAHALAPTAPLYGCGYSFGADVALTCAHPALAMWIVVAPPLRIFADDAWVAALDSRPVHVITGVHDQFAAPAAVRAATAGWRNVHVHEVAMADHFFAGSTSRVAELTTELVVAGA
jgi:alpha/beta superfamily hydrolase